MLFCKPFVTCWPVSVVLAEAATSFVSVVGRTCLLLSLEELLRHTHLGVGIGRWRPVMGRVLQALWRAGSVVAAALFLFLESVEAAVGDGGGVRAGWSWLCGWCTLLSPLMVV